MAEDSWLLPGALALAAVLAALAAIGLLVWLASSSRPARAVHSDPARAGLSASSATSTNHPRERRRRRRGNGRDQQIDAEADSGVPGIGSQDTAHHTTTHHTTTTEAGCPARKQHLLAERDTAASTPELDARRPERRPKAVSAAARAGHPPHTTTGSPLA